MNKIYHDCWEQFKRSESNNDLAICNICLKSLSCKGSATIGLRRHLEGVHNFKREENYNISIPSISRNPKRFRDNQTIKVYFKRPTMGELVSKLAAVDGLSFNRISKSEFMNDKGYSLPKNSSKVMELMLEFYEEIKKRVIQKINKHKVIRKKFSLSCDEWTSMRNKRYMDIHLYYNNKDSDNLGMVPILGSCPAEKILELITEKLKSFGIIFNDDIVSVMSDGAAVMQKFGRLSPHFHQLCYNHGLHLAVVLKVFYMKKIIADYTGELDSDKESEIESSENENHKTTDSDIEIMELVDMCLQPKIEKAITFIRKISKIFRKSPVKNTILQKYIIEDEKRN